MTDMVKAQIADAIDRWENGGEFGLLERNAYQELPKAVQCIIYHSLMECLKEGEDVGGTENVRKNDRFI